MVGAKRSILTSIGDVDGYIEEEDNPSLRVYKGLDCLSSFPSLTENPGFILGESGDDIVFLLVVEKPSVHWCVWKVHKGKY